MMAHEQCERCKKPLWSWRPTCNCVGFEIEHDGDVSIVYAADEEEAAHDYAEKYDEDDHPLLNYGEITVTVKNSEGKTTKFKCSAEPTIDYFVNEVDC